MAAHPQRCDQVPRLHQLYWEVGTFQIGQNIRYTPTFCKIHVKHAHGHQSTWSTYPAVSPTADKLRFALGWQGPRAAANEGL